MGEIYEEGVLVNKDLDKALKSYNNALQLQYTSELTRRITQIKIIKLTELASENDIYAIFELVNIYMSKFNRSANYMEAEKWLLKGIEILNTNPNPRLMTGFSAALTEVKNMQSQYNIKLHKLPDAVEKANTDAILELGLIYESHNDLKKAEELYTRAANILKDIPDKQSQYNELLKSIEKIYTV